MLFRSEYELNEKLSKEKLVLGVYVSGHPFEKYMNAFPDCTFDCSYLEDYVEDEDGNRTFNRVEDGMRITMSGIISSYRRTTTKRTGTYMAFLTIEDVYGSLECVCFPAAYEKYKSDIALDKIVIVKGKLDIDGEKGISLIIDSISAVEDERLAEAGVQQTAKEQPVLWLNAGKLDDESFSEFVNMLTNYDGGTLCKIVRGDKKYKINGQWKCSHHYKM